MRNSLLRVSFIELLDFIIYQHQTRELTFYHKPPPKYSIYATSLIMFALPISQPRLKALFWIKIALKWRYFCKKNAKFSNAGGSAPRSLCFRRLGTSPPDPQNSPPFRISGYAPRSHKGHVLFVCCRPAPNYGQKIGLSLSEDLFFFFFFPLHLILGKKSDYILVEQFLILIFVLLKFSEVPGLPLFKILRTLLRCAVLCPSV